MDVLVVDSEPASGEAVRSCLEGAGLRVQVASSGAEALEAAGKSAPDLFVVERVLPDSSGLGLCRALREDPDFRRTPIMMLSEAAAEMDRVVAFEIGVDDFITKPFHPRELALRVNAILRRTRRAAHGDAAPSLLVHGGLRVDPLQRRVDVAGKAVPLTAREFDVLSALIQQRGHVLSRRQILDEVWGLHSGKTPRVVDTHIKWIRRKLGPAGDYIETLRGVGYRFTDRPVAA